MGLRRWQIALASTLVLLTIAFYAVRYFVFPSTEFHSEMWRFLIGDIAFVFLQVLLVSMIIDGVSRRREREELRQKLNMIVGAFYSKAGTRLLGSLAESDARLAEVRDDLVPDPGWGADDYAAASRAFAAHDARIDLKQCDLERLRSMLLAEKDYMLGLLGNQSLLEHEQFTDLLWAVTHLAEELESRTDLGALAEADARHLAGDAKRAYGLLGSLYLTYLRHLQLNYPYLFSLALRTNPLDLDAHVQITA